MSFLLLLPVINALCNHNVNSLIPIIDVSNTSNFSTISSKDNIPIELSYYVLTSISFNLSDEIAKYNLKLSPECKKDIFCILDNLKNINLISNNRYSSMYYTPTLYTVRFNVSTFVKQLLDNYKMTSYSITPANIYNQFLSGGILSFVHDTDLNSDGFDDLVLLTGQKKNKIILIVGVYQDPIYNELFLKYYGFNGPDWGCSGFGYIRITDMSTSNFFVYNNEDLLDFVVKKGRFECSRTFWRVMCSFYV